MSLEDCNLVDCPLVIQFRCHQDRIMTPEWSPTSWWVTVGKENLMVWNSATIWNTFQISMVSPDNLEDAFSVPLLVWNSISYPTSCQVVGPIQDFTLLWDSDCSGNHPPFRMSQFDELMKTEWVDGWADKDFR